MSDPREPNGATHEVAIDELFYSTTDDKGIIRESNDVFVRLSRFESEQLRGAPHNIIRHPDMPGGAFKLMWDTLEAGHPFAAYVRNEAADGSAYDVLATVTPLRDGGYLSVRTRPTNSVLFDTMISAYREARVKEVEAREAGGTARDAAIVGLESLGTALERLGFRGYPELQSTMLPDEVARREFMAGPIAGEARGPKGAAARSAHSALEKTFSALEALSSEGRRVQRTSRKLAHDSTIAREASEAIRNLLPSLDQAQSALTQAPLDLWDSMRPVIEGYVGQVIEALGEMSAAASATRERIALSRLHSTVVVQFADEIEEGGRVDRDPDLTVLIGALEDGLTLMSVRMGDYEAAAARLGASVSQAQGMLSVPRDLMRGWRSGESGGELGEQMKALSAAIDAIARQLEGFGAVSDLSASRAAEREVRVALAKLHSSVGP